MRIHTAPNTDATVVGLAYDNDHAAVYSYDPNGWAHVTDTRTNVSGWVLSKFVIDLGTYIQ